MTAILELSFAILILMGLLCLSWVFFGKLLTPLGKLGAPLQILVTGKGAAEGVEYTLNSLIWLRGGDLRNCPVYLVDAGLNEEGMAVVRLLLSRWPEIRLCKPEDVERYIT